MLNIIIEEYEGKPDRHLLHKILENQHILLGKTSLEFHLLNIKIDKIMGQNEDFSAALDKLDADITAVASALATAIGSVPAGALTADQAAALIARIQGEQTKLEGLVTPTPPTVG